MKLDDAKLLRAAEILDAEARLLFDSFTNRGRWVSSDGSHESARRDHDEYRAIARHFRKAVGRL